MEAGRRRVNRVTAGLFLLLGLFLFLMAFFRQIDGARVMIPGGILVLFGLFLLAPSPADTSEDPTLPDFTIVLRGYERTQVDELIRRTNEALHSSSMKQRLAARTEIESASLQIVLRGYLMSQVDEHLQRLAAAMAVPPEVRPPAAASDAPE